MKKHRKVIEREGKFYTSRGAQLTRASNTLTESEFFGKIISAVRRLTMYWKPKQDHLIELRKAYTGSNKRTKWQYMCESCCNWYVRSEVELDHILPVGSFKTFADAPGYLERIFVEKDGWQVLCKACHKNKTFNTYS